MKKLISLILAVLMLFSLVACADSDYAMKYGDTEISQNEYLYWLSSYKALFLTYYLGSNDTDEAWSTVISDNGATIEDLLDGVARDNIKNNLVCMELFKKAGLKLDNDALNEVDTYINDLIEKAGSTSVLNDALSAYGVDSKLLKQIYTNEKKIESVKTALFEQGGELELTDDERDERFKSSYVRVKHIYINTVKDYARDDEGDLIIDSDTGTYKTRDLTEDEKAEMTALAESINARLLTGEDFDSLMNEYSADTNMKLYPDGYYVTSSSAHLPTALIEKAFTMSVGETAYVESEIGIHIIKREPLIDGAYADTKNAIFFSDFENNLKTVKLSEYLSKLSPDVLLNEELLDSFSIRTCTANYSY